MKMECHRCEYNGKGDAHCIQCASQEQYNYPYNQYILDGYDIPDTRTQEEEEQSQPKQLNLSDEQEDQFRKALFDLFDLSPLELLMLQAIMLNKDLTTFANDTNHMLNKLSKNGMTRHHAYYLRKAIGKKLPHLRSALLTMGQRKKLKI